MSKSIEPIIRLVMYQLTEVLPVNIAAAILNPGGDPTILPLNDPAQVANCYKAAKLEKFPSLIVIPGQSTPTIPQDQLDSGDFDCQVWRHDFAVFLAYADSETNAKETLTYKMARYIELIQDAVTGFEATARDDAFEASRKDPQDVRIVLGAHYIEEDIRQSFLLQTAMIEFEAYC